MTSKWVISYKSIRPYDETIRLCAGTELLPQPYKFEYELECVVDGVAHYFCVDVI